MRSHLLALSCCTLLSACGAGSYGYARTYEPLGAENGLYEQAVTPPYEDVVRDPVRYSEQLFAWFGVVEGMQKLAGGQVRITLSQRRHQDRHLCMDRAESSCRVTVSKTSSGQFQIVTSLSAKDLDGQNRIWAGSLLKVYGKVNLEAAIAEGDGDGPGLPVMAVEYRRHWPRGTYVTTAARATMRR